MLQDRGQCWLSRTRRTGAFLGAACYLLPYCICRTPSALLCEAHVTGFGLFVSLPFSTSFSSPAPASRCPPVCPDTAGGCGRGAGTWDGPSARPRGLRSAPRCRSRSSLPWVCSASPWHEGQFLAPGDAFLPSLFSVSQTQTWKTSWQMKWDVLSPIV